MPHCYLTWVPPAEEIQVPPRHLDAGQAIIFGSFNRAVKITPMTLDLWARTLSKVPGSKLLMKGSVGDQPQLQRKYLAAMAAGGVDPGRIEFLGSSHRSSHLAAYRHVDIQLDTVPEQGGITTLESLWCGVPVISWCYDDRILTRSGATICNALGLSDLIADTPEGFVAIAHALANDPTRLKDLRASLRGRMMRSPLLDLQRYTDALQVAFREMWRRYCRADPPSHLDVAALISR